MCTYNIQAGEEPILYYGKIKPRTKISASIRTQVKRAFGKFAKQNNVSGNKTKVENGPALIEFQMNAQNTNQVVKYSKVVVYNTSFYFNNYYIFSTVPLIIFIIILTLVPINKYVILEITFIVTVINFFCCILQYNR